VWGNGVSFYLFAEKQRRMNHAVIGTDIEGTGLSPYAVVTIALAETQPAGVDRFPVWKPRPLANADARSVRRGSAAGQQGRPSWIRVTGTNLGEIFVELLIEYETDRTQKTKRCEGEKHRRGPCAARLLFRCPVKTCQVAGRAVIIKLEPSIGSRCSGSHFSPLCPNERVRCLNVVALSALSDK